MDPEMTQMIQLGHRPLQVMTTPDADKAEGRGDMLTQDIKIPRKLLEIKTTVSKMKKIYFMGVLGSF